MGRIVGSDARFGLALTKLGFLDEQPGSNDQWIGKKMAFSSSFEIYCCSSVEACILRCSFLVPDPISHQI